MGDSDEELERYCSPDESLDLGLWLVFHPDLKRNAKVLAFREHMTRSIEMQKDLFQGTDNRH